MRFARMALALAVTLGLAAAARAQTTPVANAGPDQTIACVGPDGTPVNLNGMGSSVGAEFTYLWTAQGVTFSDPTSLTPIGTFPVGATEVTLTVTSTDPNTAATATASDTVVITVTDSNPPILSVAPDPALLWPPNHKLVDVHVDAVAFDACDAHIDAAVQLVSIESSEADNGKGDGNTSSDIQGADIGTDDRDFQLRAERSGPGSGRTYTALYRATDQAGNSADAVATIVVPHDMGHGGMQPDNSGVRAAKKEIAKAKKASWKAARLALRAAKKAERLAERAYKAALRAAEGG